MPDILSLSGHHFVQGKPFDVGFFKRSHVQLDLEDFPPMPSKFQTIKVEKKFSMCRVLLLNVQCLKNITPFRYFSYSLYICRCMRLYNSSGILFLPGINISFGNYLGKFVKFGNKKNVKILFEWALVLNFLFLSPKNIIYFYK